MFCYQNSVPELEMSYWRYFHNWLQNDNLLYSHWWKKCRNDISVPILLPCNLLCVIDVKWQFAVGYLTISVIRSYECDDHMCSLTVVTIMTPCQGQSFWITDTLWGESAGPRWFPWQRDSNIMMTSSNGNIFRVTGPLCGEFTGPGEFPAQRPVTWSFDVYFDLRRN